MGICDRNWTLPSTPLGGSRCAKSTISVAGISVGLKSCSLPAYGSGCRSWLTRPGLAPRFSRSAQLNGGSGAGNPVPTRSIRDSSPGWPASDMPCSGFHIRMRCRALLHGSNQEIQIARLPGRRRQVGGSGFTSPQAPQEPPLNVPWEVIYNRCVDEARLGDLRTLNTTGGAA
jgi:hypothetical protein